MVKPPSRYLLLSSKTIDGGPILLEKDFPIGDNETIQDLHKIANVEFPEMLIKVLKNVESNSLKIKKQMEKNSSYYPLRTPDDGLILWDKYDAQEIHNRIRALTNPYPCAFSFCKEKKVKFISSFINKKSFSGEPGRIYQIKKNKFLVSARQGSIWITQAVYGKTNLPFFPTHDRYQSFSTINQIALSLYKNNILNEDKNKNTKDSVFIIAEIGNNHEGSIELAKEMVYQIAETGADAVKFQTFKTESFISIKEKKI